MNTKLFLKVGFAAVKRMNDLFSLAGDCVQNLVCSKFTLTLRGMLVLRINNALVLSLYLSARFQRLRIPN
jgi:hypothetical protein